MRGRLPTRKNAAANGAMARSSSRKRRAGDCMPASARMVKVYYYSTALHACLPPSSLTLHRRSKDIVTTCTYERNRSARSGGCMARLREKKKEEEEAKTIAGCAQRTLSRRHRFAFFFFFLHSFAYPQTASLPPLYFRMLCTYKNIFIPPTNSLTRHHSTPLKTALLLLLLLYTKMPMLRRPFWAATL